MYFETSNNERKLQMEFDIKEIWKESDLLIFTTNNVIKKNNELTLGKGIAKLVRDEYKNYNIARYLGDFVKKNGNIPCLLKISAMNKPNHLLSFPTKFNWRNNSDLNLIKNSREIAEVKLANFIDQFKANNENIPVKRILSPLVGTANGKLPLHEVKPELIRFKTFIENLGIPVVFFTRNGIFEFDEK